MDFANAINLVKHGHKISRAGWNGKKQYVELARNISYLNTQGTQVNVEHNAIGSQALAFVGTSGTQLGWLASQADMLAEDWQLFEEVDAEDIHCEECNCKKNTNDSNSSQIDVTEIVNNIKSIREKVLKSHDLVFNSWGGDNIKLTNCLLEIYDINLELEKLSDKLVLE